MLYSRRAAIMAVFFAFGATIGGFAGSFPVIMHNAGIGSFEFGLGMSLSMLADVAAMSTASFLARRFSNRAMLLVLLPCVAVAAFAFMTSASPLTFFAANIAYGLAMGGTDVFMNGEGSAIENDVNKPVFATFHGMLSTSLPLFALIGSFVSTMIGTWAIALLQIVVLAVAWEFVRRKVPARPRPTTTGEGRLPLANKFPLALIAVIAGICFAGELSSLNWSANFLGQRAPRLAAIAGLGAAFYGTCNAAVRYFGDGLRRRFDDLPVLIGSIIVAMTGFALIGLSWSFASSVSAFAVVGLGTALLTPCSFALAASYAPDNRVGGLSYVGMIAGIPRVFTPWIFGWIASQRGIGFTFGLLAGALAVALAIAIILWRMRESAHRGATASL